MGCQCNCNCQKENDEKLIELKKFMQSIKKEDHSNAYLIAILHKVQAIYGYLDKEIIKEVSDYMNIPLSHIWGVATFYHLFNLAPVGKNIVSVCLGTACYVKGAEKVMQAVKDDLKIDVGGTTEDGLFSIHKTRCIGVCGLAPVMTVGDKVYGEVKAEDIPKILAEYKK
jgi:NADH-quinone oxidoreductase subunit E/NADP-reducing hydrogenase subunit HndA